MEGIKTVKAKVAAYIHPSRAADVPQGVHEILNSLLLRYNEEFEGVLLAYLAPRLVGRTAKILSGLSPYFHVNLTAKLLLFSPAPGMKIGLGFRFYVQLGIDQSPLCTEFNREKMPDLSKQGINAGKHLLLLETEGKVNKIEKDYIGVLVLGLFNTTIGVVDIRDEFEYITAHHSGRAWMSILDNRHTIELGSLIRFSVKSLQETEHIIDICGSLVEDDTGCVDWLEQSSFRGKSKGLKELKLRCIEYKGPKHKKSKDRSEHVQELKKRPWELEESHVNRMNEALNGSIGEPLLLPKRKKLN